MMPSTTDEDPFLQVQADVLSQLSTTRGLFTSYLRIRALATSSTSPELTQARQELESTLQDLNTDLQDLIDSVKAVEGDPYKYGLEIEEVQRRRRLVEEVGGEVEDMREELAKAVSQSAQGATGSNSLPDPDRLEEDGDEYAAFEQQRQVEIMQEQDQQLDGVLRTVGNLRSQAEDMGRELEEQGQLLDEVDTITDRVGGRLQNGLKKMQYVVKKNEDTLSSCCIGVLILVLIILLILVISL